MRLGVCASLLWVLMALSSASFPAMLEAQDAAPEADAIPEPPADGGAEAEAASEATAEAPPVDASSPPVAMRRLVVIDAAAIGVAPVVAQVTTDIMRRTGASMGYEVVLPDATVAAAQRIRMPYPPAPADLWRVSWAASAHRGAFARIWAEGGRYHIEITVASMDGQGPWYARDTAGAEDLRQVVERLTRSILPPPEMWMPTAGAPPLPGETATTTLPGTRPIAVRPERTAREALAHPSGRDGRRWRRPLPEIRRFSLSLQTEASIGATEGSFYNHYAGVRLDVRITREFAVGAYFAYVNLDGRDQRVSSFHVAVMGEYRIRPSNDLDLTIPIRLSVGYLAFNGPVGRISGGLAYGFDEHWEIAADLIAPTLYFLPDRVAFAFDFGLELTYKF
jgi:hypothetical protein